MLPTSHHLKRIVSIALFALLITACGGAATTSAPADQPAATETAAETPTEAAAETPTEAPAETSTDATEAVTETTPAEPAATGEVTPTVAVSETSSYPALELTNKPEVVRIGFQAIPNAELIAKQLKWHEDALGVPIEWLQFESGRDVNTAVASGSIDIGLVGSSPAANGLSSGLPYEVIAIYDVIGDAEALAVSEGIESFDDLRGKTIAAPFGSTTHYSLLQVLQANGIGLDEVTLIDANPSDLLAAWTRGDIDAAYVWQPTLQNLYDNGGHKLIASDEVAALGFPTFDLAIATKEFTTQYPEVVAVYLQNLSRAVDLYRADPDQALGLIATELGITPEVAAPQAAGLIWLTAAEQLDPTYFGTTGAPGALGGALKTTADFLVSQTVIPSAPEVEVFEAGVNPQYLELAAGQ